jgi:outer membrane lipoprotein-sorting protein
MKRFPLIFALLLESAYADPAGDAALAKIEATACNAQTQRFEYEATQSEKGKPDKKISVKVLLKGDKRLTEITAPDEVKGTKLLVLSPTQKYVWLPAFGKVRRIVSSTPVAFGFSITLEELPTQRYAGQYDAVAVSKPDAGTVITLTAKPAADGGAPDAPYGKLEIRTGKNPHQPLTVDYYGADGGMLKNELRSSYDCQGEVCSARGLTMGSFADGITTTVIRKEWKINENIPDDLFQKKNLEK